MFYFQLLLLLLLLFFFYFYFLFFYFILFYFFCWKWCRLWDRGEKFNKAKQATEENIIKRMRFARRISKAADTLRICHTDCSSTTPVVARTRWNIAIHIYVKNVCAYNPRSCFILADESRGVFSRVWTVAWCSLCSKRFHVMSVIGWGNERADIKPRRLWGPRRDSVFAGGER